LISGWTCWRRRTLAFFFVTSRCSIVVSSM
jgi:hypothetical protein